MEKVLKKEYFNVNNSKKVEIAHIAMSSEVALSSFNEPPKKTKTKKLS